MHNTNKNKIIAILLVLATPLYAYEFSFFNKTSHPLGIAIQFANSEEEPLYKIYIKPGSMSSFVPGKNYIPDIKWSFCLKNIYYAKNPTMQERAHNFEKAIWKKTNITWTNQPLTTTKKVGKKSPKQKKERTEITEHKILAKKTILPDSKSLCKDRHFEITENEHGAIIITGSTAE